MNDSPDYPQPHEGDILLFFRPHSLFDYVIKLLTHSRYYHVGIFAGNGSVVEARTRGVGLNDLAGRKGGYVVIPTEGDCGLKALEWAKTKIGDGYDHVDLLVIFMERVFTWWRINYTPNDKFTCGEFVATAFDKAGVRFFPAVPIDAVVPADFASLIPEGRHPR